MPTANLTFPVSEFLVQQAHTLDPHLSSKSTSALASTSKVTGITHATQEVASCTRDKKANVEREVTFNKVAATVAGLVTNRSALSRLPSSLYGSMEYRDG